MKSNYGILLLPVLLAIAPAARAESAFVRVSQIGYETDRSPYRAYLMSTGPETGASFTVIDASGNIAYSAAIGNRVGTWSHSDNLVYQVYALDFTVADAGTYSIAVTGPASATSPVFPVDSASALYPGLLLNSKFYFETERDGPSYVPNALRSAPGHLNDVRALVYQTPPLDTNDSIITTGTPLTATGTAVDATGGWWDAGDYMKYVETISYTVALQEIGIRDFPAQMGPQAPMNPPAPPAALSYSGNATGAPLSADFTSEAKFGLDFLLKMWDNNSKTLYYQVGDSQDWTNFPNFIGDYDIWRLPQADDHWNGCATTDSFICYRPVFVAGPAGSKISPNLAGRLAADFGLCYQLFHESDSALANRCLLSGAQIFELADTSFADPAQSVGSGSCTSGCLLTIVPFDGYPETVWDDDMELGATEMFSAMALANGVASPGSGTPSTDPHQYLRQAAQFARNYITRIYQTGNADTLNLYDVSGLAHFELYRALVKAGNPTNLDVSAGSIRQQLLDQVGDIVRQAASDAWGFGAQWTGDTTSHGAGISVMASEALALTGDPRFDTLSRRWMANILGANAWGSSFIVGDGSATFPDCIQHQVANLAGSLDGTGGGTPVLWGAASEGPATAATSGALQGMNLCPANGVDTFQIFNGNDGVFNSGATSVYQDNVQSYSTTEPAIDLTSTSFLMWSWRLALNR